MNQSSLKKPKVFFIIPTLQGGGAERVFTTLLRHFDRGSFDILFVIINAEDAVFHNEIPEDISVLNLNKSRIRYSFFHLIREIWKFQPDIVFSTLGHLNICIGILKPFLPPRTICIARESILVSQHVKAYGFPKLWIKLYRRFYRNLDMIVCQSKDMQKDLLTEIKIPKNKTRLINNPVDIDRIHTKIKNGAGPQKKILGGIYLVAVGRLVHQKGFDILIEALHKLNDKRLRLVILGDGPLKNELETLATTLGVTQQVSFVGFKANPFSYIASADAFVLSSRYEGFPNVVLEAMACGTPVISTPAPGGIFEILAGVPECGIAKEISAASLAESIESWIKTSFGQRVSLESIVHLSAPFIAKQYQDLFFEFFPR